MRIGTFKGITAAGIAMLLIACDNGTAPDLNDLVERFELEPMPPMVHPADNPPNPDRIALGRLLFFDAIMSGLKDVSCGTCHHPQFGMGDGLDVPVGPTGIGVGPERVFEDPTMVNEARNSPTVINAGFNRFVGQETSDGFMFWDGRIRRLENLVTLPQREFTEMRHDVYPIERSTDSILGRIREIGEYEQLFRQAFPAKADSVDSGLLTTTIDSLSLSQSVAQFIRSLVGVNSPYDQFIAGDTSALTLQQKWGMELFYGKANCVDCHSSPMLTDFDFHVVGARQLGPGFQTTPHEDFGRWHVTELEEDKYRFRTPTLRNVAETGPYMHSGGYYTLREVVEFFNRGGGDLTFVPNELLDIQPLGLNSREIDAIVAFLESLTDQPEIIVPDRLPSGLPPPNPIN